MHKDILHTSTQIFTAPFVNKHTHDKENVLVGFSAREYALQCIGHAKNNIRIEGLTIKQLTHYSNILAMPLVVIVNAYCETDDVNKCTTYDIFYKTHSNPMELYLTDFTD
jgi:hypothetical protein